MDRASSSTLSQSLSFSRSSSSDSSTELNGNADDLGKIQYFSPDKQITTPTSLSDKSRVQENEQDEISILANIQQQINLTEKFLSDNPISQDQETGSHNSNFSASSSSLSGETMLEQSQLISLVLPEDISSIQLKNTIFADQYKNNCIDILFCIFRGSITTKILDDFKISKDVLVNTLNLLEDNLVRLYNGDKSRQIYSLRMFNNNDEHGSSVKFQMNINVPGKPSISMFRNAEINPQQLHKIIRTIQIHLNNYKTHKNISFGNEDMVSSLAALPEALLKFSSVKKEDCFTLFFLSCDDHFDNNVNKNGVAIHSTLIGEVLANYNKSEAYTGKFRKMTKFGALPCVLANDYAVVINGVVPPDRSGEKLHHILLIGVHACLEHMERNKESSELVFKIDGSGSGAFIAASVYSYMQNLYSNSTLQKEYTRFCVANNLKEVNVENLTPLFNKVKIDWCLLAHDPLRGGIPAKYDISGGLPNPYGTGESFVFVTNSLFKDETESRILNPLDWALNSKYHDISHLTVADPEQVKLIHISEPTSINNAKRSDRSSNALSRKLTYKLLGLADPHEKKAKYYENDTLKSKDYFPKRNTVNDIYGSHTSPTDKKENNKYYESIQNIVNKANNKNESDNFNDNSNNSLLNVPTLSSSSSSSSSTTSAPGLGSY